MEAVIMEIFKESAITGAFIYLLHHFLGKNAQQMENQSATLQSVGDTLAHVSMTLVDVSNNMESMNQNMENMDGRIKQLEERGATHG